MIPLRQRSRWKRRVFMTGAMYAGVAGLKTHMSALNVIGNNVANVNTVAYKSKRYVFSEALYTSVHSGSDGTAVLGGRNPAQIGYGASVGSIDLDMSTKSYQPTGKLLDSMIDGDGFYIVGDKSHNMVTDQETLQGMNLTRRGDFQFINGYLVDGDGQVVYGFLNTKVPGANENDPSSTYTVPVLTPIRLPKMIERMEGGKTVVDVIWPQWGTLKSAGDAAGGEPYMYTPELKSDIDANYQPDLPDGALDGGNADTNDPLSWVVLQNLSVEENGRIVGTTGDDKQIIVGYIALAQVDNPNGVTHVDGHYYQALGGAGESHLCSPGGAVQFVPQNGNNNNNANVPANWQAANAKMELNISQAGDTTLINGGLEMPGTDLADEISNMICIQRGYQANTRIVTVTDSMLEELVNMKR